VDRIYLDHNATTPVDPRVRAAMEPALGELFGNPSSLHFHGQRARAALDEARAEIAALIAATPAEIVLTSGGTEADNLALRGAAAGAPPTRRRVLYSPIEHHAVLKAAAALAEAGFAPEPLRVGREGRVDLEDLQARVDERTLLVAVMLANNETGVVQPVGEAAALAHAKGALLLCDAVQAAGKLKIDVSALGVDLLALSAHKVYGPKGAGALYVRRGTAMKSLLRGGAQERNRRAGTENVPAAVGFGRAAVLARESLEAAVPRVGALRDALEARLLAIPGSRVNGGGVRVCNTTNVSFAGCDAERLLLALDLRGLSVSTGAACAAGGIEPSHVLQAMGLGPEQVQASLRFSLGRGTTEAEVEQAGRIVADVVERHRAAASTRTGAARS
jgi:cysteine desulfurase